MSEDDDYKYKVKMVFDSSDYIDELKKVERSLVKVVYESMVLGKFQSDDDTHKTILDELTKLERVEVPKSFSYSYTGSDEISFVGFDTEYQASFAHLVKCECGVDATYGRNSSPSMHRDYCPKHRKQGDNT